ncbi:MAG: hypothetical protein [Bacteriophage sp.]|nr:MAG: hypothetical protein [Bacteriophage sp.]
MLENIVLILEGLVYILALIMALASFFMICVMIFNDFKEYLKRKKRGY